MPSELKDKQKTQEERGGSYRENDTKNSGETISRKIGYTTSYSIHLNNKIQIQYQQTTINTS
jgi:hypothetical protein